MSDISHTWTVTTVEGDCWRTSETFFIKNADNIAFNLYARLIGGNQPRLQIKVHKGQTDPAKASIHISLTKIISDVAHMDDWKCVSPIFEFAPPSSPSTIRHTNLKSYLTTITCTITWYGAPKPIHSPTQYDNFKDYVMKSEFSDVTIAVDGVELPAHKLILAAQSPVFMKMLTTDMRESKENRISIEDFDAEIIKELMTYLYTGNTKAKCNTDTALQLLAVAEMYEIIELKDLCTATLAKNLSTANVLSIFEAADQYNAQELRQTSIVFMVNHKADIINSSEFKKMCREKPELMFEFTILVVGEK